MLTAESNLCLLNSPGGSDESSMSVSVPSMPSSLIDSGSASVASATSSCSARRNSRKSQPCRALSWQDASPGVVLKFAPCGESILLLPNNLSRSDYTRFSQLPCAPRLFRSQSITSIEGHAQLMMQGRTLRPRSFSLSEIPDASSCASASGMEMFTNSSQESFLDEIDIGSAEDEETATGGATLSSIMRQRGSQQQQQQKKKRFNAAGTSLSHLVPNKLLMRVSRRISSHSPADGCKCTSCHQTVTPYWRDGWSEDVMLCNACGLRFQKFAQRCHSCMYIPRKEDGVEDTCPQCEATWIWE